MHRVTIDTNIDMSQRDMVTRYVKDILDGLEEEKEVYIALPEEGRDNMIVDRILTMIEGYLWMKMPVDDEQKFYKDIFFSPKPDFVFIKDPTILFTRK